MRGEEGRRGEEQRREEKGREGKRREGKTAPCLIITPGECVETWRYDATHS